MPSNNREYRIAKGHFQGSQRRAEPLVEKKLNCALPTRFSAGTKPQKRLSDELSRLSPIIRNLPSGPLTSNLVGSSCAGTRFGLKSRSNALAESRSCQALGSAEGQSLKKPASNLLSMRCWTPLGSVSIR